MQEIIEIMVKTIGDINKTIKTIIDTVNIQQKQIKLLQEQINMTNGIDEKHE